MKVAKSLLLGSAAVLATVAGAQAADLPTRKAAPVQYVKICDAYGAGFFYIPGTDTCLRVGGLVLADWQVSNAPARYVLPSGGVSFAGANALGSPAWVAGGGSVPGYIPSKGRDAVSSLALGRLELDARTQSPWGTVRAFMRVDSTFGSAAVSNTGGAPAAVLLGTSIGTAVGTGYASKEATYLNKAFLQFAGITMGRIQSMFDFYADAVGYTAQVGSNQTVNAIAYTATFGGGFSATLSVEDEVSHRGPSASVITGFPGTGLAAPIVQFNGTRMPDVVANIRVDQPWGAAQLSGAIHSNNRSLWQTAAFTPGGIPVTTPTWSSNSTNGIGFAIQGGLKFNLNMLAPGDVLWLQATFAKGAIGYANGSNFAFVNGIDYSLNYGVGLARMSSGNGWAGGVDNDCVWTWSGSCEQSNALAVVAAMRHYWTPTISSTLSASYYSVWYSQNATNPALGAFAAGSTTFGTGLTNYRQTILATGLEWNPIKNFGIGGEIAWTHGVVSRPQGMAQDLYLAAYGMSFKSNNDLIRGRVRMYRAF